MLRFRTRIIAVIPVIAVCWALAACNSGTADEPTPLSSAASTPIPTAVDSAHAGVMPSISDLSLDARGETVASNLDGADASEDQHFDPARPSLLGIALFDTDSSVAERFGNAYVPYTLPGDGSAIDMWEYPGYAFGYDESGRVVYIEISSDDVATGIMGLHTGMSGEEAAKLLEIAYHPDLHVLTLELNEGWLKLDLDPDTHEVLSIKLIAFSS